MDKFADECGVLAMIQHGNEYVACSVLWGLQGIQHRGQESVGLAVCDEGKLIYHRGKGLVTEVFKSTVNYPKGHVCLGHVQYGNAYQYQSNNIQPLQIIHSQGEFAVALNGGLNNNGELIALLKRALPNADVDNFSDSEVIAHLIAFHFESDIIDAIKKTMKVLVGGYAFIVLTPDTVIGVRDPHGIRPLCLGTVEQGYVIVSEDCVFNSIDASYVRDVCPGEILEIKDNGLVSTSHYVESDLMVRPATCIFEYVYFARPDSTIDGVNVSQSRQKAGMILAKEHPADADMVVAVPDSGIPAALGYANQTLIPFAVGLIKNRYIGRTFIEPNAKKRKTSVKLKLNPIKSIIEGKRIVLVDDSLVRGTTMKSIVELLKLSGILEIHLRISSPPVKHTCFFGIDTPDESDLVANHLSKEQIRLMLGVDSIEFISMEGLLASVQKTGNGYCTGCFNQCYPMACRSK